MELNIRSKEQQMIDVFEEYINGNKNEIFDYCLEDYMQIALDYISSLEQENKQLESKLEQSIAIADTNSELADKYERVIDKALELLQLLHYQFPDYDSIHKNIEDIQKVLKEVE